MSEIWTVRNRILMTGKKWLTACDILIQEVNIALVGKYIQLHDAYISVVEALKHGGIASRATVNLQMGGF